MKALGLRYQTSFSKHSSILAPLAPGPELCGIHLSPFTKSGDVKHRNQSQWDKHWDISVDVTSTNSMSMDSTEGRLYRKSRFLPSMGSPVNGPSTSLGEALETWNHLGWCGHCTALWDIGNGSIVLPRTIHAYFPLQQITPLPFLLQQILFSHLHLLRPPHLPPDSLVVKLAQKPENSQKVLGWSHETRKLGWKHMIELSFLCRNSTPTSLGYLIIGVYTYIYIYICG